MFFLDIVYVYFRAYERFISIRVTCEFMELSSIINANLWKYINVNKRMLKFTFPFTLSRAHTCTQNKHTYTQMHFLIIFSTYFFLFLFHSRKCEQWQAQKKVEVFNDQSQSLLFYHVHNSSIFIHKASSLSQKYRIRWSYATRVQCIIRWYISINPK